jgi:hypothetical protein
MHYNSQLLKREKNMKACIRIAPRGCPCPVNVHTTKLNGKTVFAKQNRIGHLHILQLVTGAVSKYL